MSEHKSICILGRQPALGMAELESLYGAEHVKPASSYAFLDIPAEEINFSRLGGTIKVARILTILDSSSWESAKNYLMRTIPEHLSSVEGKLTLGVSIYGLDISPPRLNRELLAFKKVIKQTDKPVRIVPNKSLELNSAQVLHNKLTRKGGWELLLIRDGSRTIVAQTIFVQDIEAYGARDQARPKRDARVGMLPPKLAQIMINLAVGHIRSSEPFRPVRILDPFCGTGVVLQEGLLMNHSVVGTDIDPRMVEYSTANIQWLFNKFPALEGQVDIELGDATDYKWPRFSAVVSEAFLGRPLNALPSPDKLKEIIQDANIIIKKFLVNLELQLKSGQKVVLAVPAWRKPNGQLIHLPLLDKLTEMGYNYLDLKHVPRERLVYFREDQVVARQILRIEKK